MNYRNKTTGAISTQGEIRQANKNRSFPRVWNADVCELLDIEPILASPKPTATALQTVTPNGVVQDALGNWVEAWTVVDSFSETTDEDGVVTSKSDKEAAYTASESAKLADSARKQRDSLISDTDYYALTDVTMGSGMTIYRQALRDISSQDGFPNEITWPTKP